MKFFLSQSIVIFFLVYSNNDDNAKRVKARIY